MTAVALLAVLVSAACAVGPIDVPADASVFVQGWVLSEGAGDPIAGATIRLVTPEGATAGHTLATTTSGPSGRYEIEAEPGTTVCDRGFDAVRVQATHADYTQDQVISTDCASRSIDISMRPRATETVSGQLQR